MVSASSPVLVVNDDEDTSQSLRALLEFGGFAVETASDGWDALCKLYEGLRPCLIVLDLMMPVMDGYEFREQQLRMPDVSDIPVIVVSAVFDVHSAAIRHLRAKAYIRTPAEAGQLLESVRQYCSTN